MPDLIKNLQLLKKEESDAAKVKLLQDALQEITDLRQKEDALEEILIILARTEFPWDVDGKTTAAFPIFKERYLKAMHEVSDLLNLDLRSTITRIEPRN